VFHRNLTWVARIQIMQEETWANNANAFIAQEEDTTQSYSPRVAGFDLLSVRSFLHRNHGV
jgi:hypothetical protein